MSTTTSAVLGPATTTAKHVSIEEDDVVLHMGNHPIGIRIPIDLYSVWIFDKDESPLTMYNGELQYPCFLQFKGDKKSDGTRGAFTQGGTDWFGFFNFFSRINSEKLFRQLCKGKYDDKQIKQWEDNPQPEEIKAPV